ncbi:hypothetical protein HX837_07330 [Marine Group I thaumarchaeote]|uniref:Uncharacterized protein n=1 Tax=Marine Group I thaumarchaeote TaxID=2511932 RepID=A0A7K4MQY5_9ARCH|nr:hypothetical protein [Marine Group I thaumarchaeote]
MDDVQRRNLAIQTLAPNSAYHAESDGTIIEWLTPDIPQSSEAEIDAQVVIEKSEYDAQAYARERASAYPSNGDQWDMIYKDNKNSTTTHADAVEVVKTKWPKDNSGPVE